MAGHLPGCNERFQPKGEDLPHPLRKKPRGRTPRGMRWEGTNEAGRWVNDNKGSKDDPIDLCD